MRDAFFDEVYALAQQDRNLMFLTADMGAFSLNRFKKDLPEQFVNVGVAEQSMISIAAGLALGGKRVFAYSIAPFATMRCYEQIKIDLCCMQLPVTIVGVGAGYMYGSDGPTHHATQDIAVMRALPEITILNPSDSTLTAACARMAYHNPGPTYVRVEKGKLPLLYEDPQTDFSGGFAQLKHGADVTLNATGIMVHRAHEAAAQLARASIDAGIVDLYRLKPFQAERFLEAMRHAKKIVTLEENSLIGGLGSLVSEVLTDHAQTIPLKRIAAKDSHCYDYGEREWIHTRLGLDVESIVKEIADWCLGG